MLEGYKKYKPTETVNLADRKWPQNTIKKAPTWCSVDLRDGNQALVNPMNIEQKIEFFKLLTKIGFKEIEIGFPAASDIEYETTRALIENNLIPDDVTVQVLVQCKKALIEKTFAAIKGAKNVIVHFYNSTSKVQREIVFHTDIEGITKMAVDAAEIIKKHSELLENTGTKITYEYSPESFTGTELTAAVKICDAVCDALGANEENKVIINLPSTVECSTPNIFADRIEYMSKNLKHRSSVILSIHPHNDRGTGVATSELGLLAGAERLEGTIFGNGERTGNADIMNLALNMYTQGIDPQLDFSNLTHIREVYEECTGMNVGERHPYAGELVFTAFSGSHQDAINKGLNYINKHNCDCWNVPYLPIDPADLGRKYEPIIRINSQSGKGGAAFVMQSQYGYNIPKYMHAEFGGYVQDKCEILKRELMPDEILAIFKENYLAVNSPYYLKRYRLFEENGTDESVIVDFEGILNYKGIDYNINGKGNGPIDAFFTAITSIGITDYRFVSYNEHAISRGADSKAVSYIHLNYKDNDVFGVGMDNNISLASIKGIICAINRNEKII